METVLTAQHHEVRIRRAALADADALLEFAARVYYETFSEVNTPENLQAYITSAFTLRQIETELNDPRSTFYLLHVEAKLAGYAKLRAGGAPECVSGDAPVEMVRFYIDRAWHGTGLAAALMEHCLAEAKREGFTTMYLGVWEQNLRAQAFYRKWHFQRVGQHIFHMGSDPQVDWWMMRPM